MTSWLIGQHLTMPSSSRRIFDNTSLLGSYLFLKFLADSVHRLELGDIHIPKPVANQGHRIMLIGFLITIYTESNGEDGHLNYIGATLGKKESEY